ncbi:unnamed protein product, partial [Brachionus calyciflorus]
MWLLEALFYSKIQLTVNMYNRDVYNRLKQFLVLCLFIVFNNIRKNNQEKKIEKDEFNELLITQTLKISDYSTQNLDSSIHEVFYCSERKMFGIQLISIPEDTIDRMICTEEN